MSFEYFIIVDLWSHTFFNYILSYMYVLYILVYLSVSI